MLIRTIFYEENLNKVKCPKCNSEINLFKKSYKEDLWHYYRCNHCGARLKLNGKKKLLINMLILSLGLSIATFFDDSPLLFIIIALSVIIYVGRNLYNLVEISDELKGGKGSR